VIEDECRGPQGIGEKEGTKEQCRGGGGGTCGKNLSNETGGKGRKNCLGQRARDGKYSAKGGAVREPAKRGGPQVHHMKTAAKREYERPVKEKRGSDGPNRGPQGHRRGFFGNGSWGGGKKIKPEQERISHCPEDQEWDKKGFRKEETGETIFGKERPSQRGGGKRKKGEKESLGQDEGAGETKEERFIRRGSLTSGMLEED